MILTDKFKGVKPNTRALAKYKNIYDYRWLHKYKYITERQFVFS